MIFWPERVYIPGKNERHAEGAFDAVCETAMPSMSVEALSECAAFQHGLLYLEHGYYWEAHEVLEPVWMALNDETRERIFVQALIQIANAQLKNLMGRRKAAIRLCGISRELLDRAESQQLMGVSRSDYDKMLDKLELALK